MSSRYSLTPTELRVLLEQAYQAGHEFGFHDVFCDVHSCGSDDDEIKTAQDIAVVNILVTCARYVV
jgi:hypothetical protein